MQAGDKGIRLPVYLILARFLEPAAFGLVALGLVYIEFVQLFMNQGLTSAIVQREDLEREHLESAFWGNVVVSLVLAMGSWLAATPIARLMGQTELESIVRWLALGFMLGALSATQNAILRRGLRFQSLAVRTIGGQLVAGTVGITMAVAGAGVWSLVAMELTYQAVAAILLWRVSDWRPRLRFSFRHYRELFAFGVNILGVSVLRYGRNRADHALVGGVLGATALGYYSLARTIINGVSGLLMGSIAPVLWPTFARLQRDAARLARAIYQAAELQALIVCPAFVGIAVIAPEIVEGLLGARWAPSVPVLRAFAVAAVIQGVTTLNMGALTATGLVNWRLRLEVLIAGGSLAAMALALPYGIAAVAWAFAGSLYVLVPIELWIAVRLLPIHLRPYLRQYVTPLAASLAMWGVIEAARRVVAGLPQPGLLIALILIGALAYGVVILLAAPGVVRRARHNLDVARGRDGDSRDLEAMA